MRFTKKNFRMLLLLAIFSLVMVSLNDAWLDNISSSITQIDGTVVPVLRSRYLTFSLDNETKKI